MHAKNIPKENADVESEEDNEEIQGIVGMKLHSEFFKALKDVLELQ